MFSTPILLTTDSGTCACASARRRAILHWLRKWRNVCCRECFQTRWKKNSGVSWNTMVMIRSSCAPVPFWRMVSEMPLRENMNPCSAPAPGRRRRGWRPSNRQSGQSMPAPWAFRPSTTASAGVWTSGMSRWRSWSSGSPAPDTRIFTCPVRPAWAILSVPTGSVRSTRAKECCALSWAWGQLRWTGVPALIRGW